MKASLVFAFSVTIALSANASQLSGIPTIVDGDTLDLQGTRIRLHGIDAPEAGQTCRKPGKGTWKCGDAAIDRLAELSKGGITCSVSGDDVYGRSLAICHGPDGADINRMLVKDGFAWAFRKYSADYIAVEEHAKSKKVGIWQAETETPWDFRAAKWAVAQQTSPDGCPIKGNISKGGRIYHTPWSKWYTKTSINEKAGERWFCTEAEAIEAGWRAPD